MYLVYYRYNVYVELCGCCSYSANELKITHLPTDGVIEDSDEAITFDCESDLVEYVSDVFGIQKDEIVVDRDSEYL